MAENLDLLPGGVPGADTPSPGLDLLPNLPKPAPFKEGFGAGVSGVKSNLLGAAALVAHGAGAAGAEAKLLAKSNEAGDEAAAHSRQIKQVDWTSPGSIADHFKYLLGNAVPSLATMAAGGAAGRVLGKAGGFGAAGMERAMLTGAVAPDVALEAGGIYPEALKTGVANPAARAAIGGAAAASLDFLPLLAAEKYMAAAGKGGFGAIIKGAVKGAPVGAALEGVQETLQSVVERAAAGQSLTDPEAMSDYLNSFAGGAVPGAGFGAVIGGHRASQAPVQESPLPAPAASTSAAPAIDSTAVPVADSQFANPEKQPLALEAKDEPLSLIPKTTPLEDAWTAHNALEDQHAGAERTLREATTHLEALDKQIKGLGRRVPEPLKAERAATEAMRQSVQTALESFAPKLSAAKVAVSAAEFAEKRSGIKPNTGSEIPESSIIKPVNYTSEEQSAKAVEGVHALMREQGVAIPASYQENFDQIKFPKPLEIVNQRARDKVDKAPDEKTRQGAVEAAAVQAAQMQIETLGGAAELPIRTIVVLKNAIVSIVKEAAALPTTEAAQQHIAVEVPKALKGRVKAQDAAELAATMVNAVGQAHTLYSKGAVQHAFNKDEDPSGVAAALMHDFGGRLRNAIDYAKTKIKTGSPDMRAKYQTAANLLQKRLDAQGGLEVLNSKGAVRNWKKLTVEEAEKLSPSELDQAIQYYMGKASLDARGTGYKTDADNMLDMLEDLRGEQNSKGAMTSDQFYSLPQAAKEAAVDAFDQARAIQGEQLITRLRDIIGHDPHLTVNTFTAAPGSPIGSYTRVSALKSIISMALNAKNGLSIADHEGFHYAEDHVLDSAERQVIRNAFAPGSRMFKQLLAKTQAYDRENRTHVSDEVTGVPAEARTYGFEFWRRGELTADGALARVFEKLRQFFDRIVNAVKGLGFQSYEDIFTALDRGQFAERSRNGAQESMSRRESMLASRGSNAPQTESTEFKRWFGGSKVVDTAGKPLMVHHATTQDFSVFKTSSELGAHFGTAEQSNTISGYGAEDATNGTYSPRTVPVYLSLKNPLRLTDSGSFHPLGVVGQLEKLGIMNKQQADKIGTMALGKDFVRANTALRNAITKAGYDGVVYSNLHEAKEYLADSYIAFEPAQIKSATGNRGTFDPEDPDILRSEAAVALDREMKAGDLQDAQLYEQGNQIITNAKLSDLSGRDAFGGVWAEMNGSVTQWFKKNILTPNFISRSSEGYKNVYRTLNTYGRYKAVLVERMLKEQMPSWYSASQETRNAATDALLKRTVEGYAVDSKEFRDFTAALSPEQKSLFDQATKMIAGFLDKELEVDVAMYTRNISNEEDRNQMIADRLAQVQSLKDTGYVPLQRYGDHTVHIYKDAVKPDGKPYKQTAALIFRNSAGLAQTDAKMYEAEIARMGAPLKVEVGTHYKSARDTTISVQQFLDTARRNGVPLTSAERERIVKALSQADSLMRNRLMRRQGVPGFSTDGMRILHEFGVRTAGKIAYAKFAPAIDAAADGRPVEADIVQGEAVIKADQILDDATNLWKKDGALDGFTHNLANELTDYVLVPDHTGGWSRKLRGAAMVYFIGGSISGGLVNAMSVPMMVIPELSIHTDYTNAMTTTLSSWKTAWRHQDVLRDVAKLRDKTGFPVPEIDNVPGLRNAMIEAADRLLDTEIHQIMGIAQGSLYSQSRGVQKAMEAWMAPFRISEQTNRITAFIAAYKVGQSNNMQSQALYRFAGEMVDATQNNYNEANRPGAARNPIFALMFMFKSFPLFMTEAIGLMYKANPKSAVYMLLGLTAMTGVQGLPFAEALENLIDTISQHLFNSPFNSRRAMRNVIKSASEAITGYDMSELVLRGTINEVFGISASSRIGAGDFVPGSRLGTADADQGKVLESMLGAPYAMMKDTLANAGKFAGGVATGDWKQSVDALRAGAPIALRNIIKGGQQLNDGYASDAGGKKLVDISGPSAVFQLAGLSSAALNRAYEMDKIDKQTLAFYQQVGKDMTSQLVRALRDGDSAKVQEIQDARDAWNKANPEMPLMANPAAVRRDIMLAGIPLNARTLRNLPRQLRGSSVAAEGSSQ